MPITLNASTASGLIATSDTSGNIELQSNGTTKATVSSTGLAIGQYNPTASLITSGTAVASTSGTSIDFTGIPSWVKRVTVMFNNVSSGGTSNQLIQVGAGSVQTTGYVSAGTFFSASGVATTYSTSGFLLNKFTNAGIVNGSIQISLLGSNIWTVQGGAALNSLAYGCASYGTVTTSGTLDRVRITFANGTDTFTAGSINILYE